MSAVAALFAHPDDETYATGGTLARCAADGVRVSLYCATDGDAGQSSGIPVSNRAELGALRRAELRAACAVLGIASVVHGGHGDGMLASTEPDIVIGEMVQLLRLERPDVVLTFGPEGAPTMHRDHRAISRLATSAVLLAGTATAFPEQLADGLRPIEGDFVSPVDGKLRNFGVITDGLLEQVKGKTYTVAKFLGDEVQAKRYNDGAFFNLYLSPQDYHHVHSPVAVVHARLGDLLDAQLQRRLIALARLVAV